ncbi:MAG: hypothetical protein RI906_2733 [Pseudomonadota bacterium]|jgi:hypothetical protein
MRPRTSFLPPSLEYARAKTGQQECRGAVLRLPDPRGPSVELAVGVATHQATSVEILP